MFRSLRLNTALRRRCPSERAWRICAGASRGSEQRKSPQSRTPSPRRGEVMCAILQDDLHRLGNEAEPIALLGKMTEAGPRQMIDKRQHALGGQHVHHLDT